MTGDFGTNGFSIDLSKIKFDSDYGFDLTPIPMLPQRDAVVPGLAPDEPTTVNERGGKQSATPYRFDLFPPLPMFDVARVLGEGAEKHSAWNWERISTRDNLNHALQHIYAYLVGDESDEHLAHAVCRCLFAAHTDKIDRGIIEAHGMDDN